MSAHAALEARFRRLGLLSRAAAMLHWDWATMMPPSGAEARAAQLAELSLIRHESLTDARVCDLLDAADALDDGSGTNLRGMRRRSTAARSTSSRGSSGWMRTRSPIPPTSCSATGSSAR